MRYLLFLIVAIIVFLLWRASMRRSAGVDPTRRPEAKDGEMVQCRRCGVYLPKEDAIADGAFFFCSAEHRDVDRA